MIGRQEEINELERLRDSKVVVYVTGDRVPVGAAIAEDAVRPFFDVLRSIGRVPKLDLFVYSRGGGTEVPWRIASALRQYADTWSILVPFRANSAATLLALGADSIILGRHGELGPIDPILSIQRQSGVPGQPGSTPLQDTISVEDVMTYFSFVRDQVGLTDQSVLAQSLERLGDRLDAVDLGRVYRTRSHIRDVAHRMLTSRFNRPSERVMETIVETLATRVYAHGHAIGLTEASEIGLPVESPSEDTETAMWNLLAKYEDDLQLRNPIDPLKKVIDDGKFTDEVAIAVVESSDTLFEYRGQLDIRAVRTLPETLNIALNLNPQLPANMDPNELPAEIHELFQQLPNQLLPLAQEAVNEALEAQTPIVGAEFKFLGGNWTQVKPKL